MSANSQKRTFVGALEVQNQAIGWLRKGCGSLDGSSVVQFPRIWMSSGECRFNVPRGAIFGYSRCRDEESSGEYRLRRCDLGIGLIEPKKIEEGALAFHSGRWRIAARVTNAVIVSLLATIYILGKPLKGPLTRIGLDQPFRRVYVRITRGIRVYLLTKTMQDQIVADDRMVPEEEWSTRFREAISDLANKNSPEELGDYLEFGVYNGNSLSSAYKVVEELGYEHVRFFGFDSFEGLPEKAAIDDDEPWSPKMYECDIEITRKYLNARGVNWDRVFLLKGWFSDTLNQGTIEKFSIRKASVIMVDCDLYSSTVEALDFSEPLIQDEAIIFFDDWHSGGLAEKNKGEKLAFSEFLEKNPSFSVASLESYSENSEAFRITRSANFL